MGCSISPVASLPSTSLEDESSAPNPCSPARVITARLSRCLFLAACLRLWAWAKWVKNVEMTCKGERGARELSSAGSAP